LNLLPDGAPEIARRWPQHLAFIGGLCVLTLLVARMRLDFLLRKG
jgi:hypothetical protein